MYGDFKVTGTLVWYYYICKREVWLMARSIVPDQEHQSVEIGRIITENRYMRDQKEVDFGHFKVDYVRENGGNILVGEVKKSSRFKESARMQLAFYLTELEELGYKAKGELTFPEERRKEEVILTDSLRAEIANVKKEIAKIALQEKPPKLEQIGYCKSCAYQEMCWA